jgi:hypothetical protein
MKLKAFGKLTLAFMLALGAFAFNTNGASAAPTIDKGVAIAAGASSNIDQAHWRRYHHWHHPHRHYWRHHYHHYWRHGHHHHHHH